MIRPQIPPNLINPYCDVCGFPAETTLDGACTLCNSWARSVAALRSPDGVKSLLGLLPVRNLRQGGLNR